MSNIVLLTAAGVGSRTNQSIPKQFISVKDKPLIVYTMENFENNNDIDEIVVVCLKGWENCLKSYAEQFKINKLKSIVIGGNTGYESIRNGLMCIKNFAKDDDIVLIHDGNRPLTSAETISECIRVAKDKGNAIAVIPVVEVVFSQKGTRKELLNRDELVRVQTPQGARLNKLIETYERAEKESKQNCLGFCSLLYEFNEEIFFVRGSEKNFKITYNDDIEMFKGLIGLNE